MIGGPLHIWAQWDRLAQSWIERACDPSTSSASVCQAMMARLHHTEQLQQWMLAVMCGMALFAAWTIWELARRRSRRIKEIEAAEAEVGGTTPDPGAHRNHPLPIGGKHVRRR